MARKKTEEPLARLPAVPVGSVPMGGQPTATEERRAREWEELIDAIGTDGRIRVWSIVDGKPIWGGEMSADGFTLDLLMDTYGGGDKSLVFYQGKEKVDTVRVSLDPAVPIRNPRAPRPVAGQPQANALGDFTTMMTAMATQQMNSMNMMQTMMAAMASTNAETIKGITALVALRPQERDPMELVKTVLEITKPATTTPATELFSVFEKGMNVAAKLNGGDDDGTLALAREGLGVVAKIVENNGAARAAGATATGTGATGTGTNQPRQPRLPTAGPSVNAVSTPHPSGSGSGGDVAGAPAVEVVNDRPWVKVVRPSAGFLLLAIGQFAPDTVANMIADRLADGEFQDLIEDIESGTPAEFVDRFRGYFGIASEQVNDETMRWMLETVQSIKGLVDDGSDSLHPEDPAA